MHIILELRNSPPVTGLNRNRRGLWVVVKCSVRLSKSDNRVSRCVDGGIFNAIKNHRDCNWDLIGTIVSTRSHGLNNFWRLNWCRECRNFWTRRRHDRLRRYRLCLASRYHRCYSGCRFLYDYLRSNLGVGWLNHLLRRICCWFCCCSVLSRIRFTSSRNCG